MEETILQLIQKLLLMWYTCRVITNDDDDDDDDDDLPVQVKSVALLQDKLFTLSTCNVFTDPSMNLIFRCLTLDL